MGLRCCRYSGRRQHQLGQSLPLHLSVQSDQLRLLLQLRQSRRWLQLDQWGLVDQLGLLARLRRLLQRLLLDRRDREDRQDPPALEDLVARLRRCRLWDPGDQSHPGGRA